MEEIKNVVIISKPELKNAEYPANLNWTGKQIRNGQVAVKIMDELNGGYV